MRETSLPPIPRILARAPTADAKDEKGDEEEEILGAGAMAGDGKEDLQLLRRHGRGRTFLDAMARDHEGGAVWEEEVGREVVATEK